ncbi:hypothetical protein OG369_42870 [Streptomyces sp. NBC_01221]|uniref:hypothetical protein n=1 Tax=Streptomyces sp. NBC_01221 TaxID=2903782 RepID=UPI00224D344C|nr:hypothetical protein [Streptomyces sp. NBC_01221]MCX4792522.1 hypothetical protein [Streptomyces sp. NBC_01221]
MNDIEDFEQGRRAPFTMLGDWVAVSGVDPNARSIYWDIKAHVNENRGTGTAWPPRDFLALLAGDKQARTMDPYLRQLEAINAIGAERERQVAKMRSRNLYKIHDTPPRGWDGPASHAEVWEWLREDKDGCRQYYVDRKAWLKDIEDAWSRIKQDEKERGAKPSAPVSKAGHRAWLKKCHGLWVARRKGCASSPRSAVQRTTESSGDEPARAGDPSMATERCSGSAVQRTTQCGTAHPGSAAQRTGTTSKGNKKEEEAGKPRSGGDVRRTSTSGSSAREVESGCAASGKTSPSPTQHNDTRGPTRGQKSGSNKAKHTREQLTLVTAVRAHFPAEFLGGLPDVPTLSQAILDALAGDVPAADRTVEQLGARIQQRWDHHGWASKFYAGQIDSLVGAAVAMVRPLKAGDRYGCANPRCEAGVGVDTKEDCQTCPERLEARKAQRAQDRGQERATGANSAPACTGSTDATMPPQRTAHAPASPPPECDGRNGMCGRPPERGSSLCQVCLADAAEQHDLENAGAPAPF